MVLLLARVCAFIKFVRSIQVLNYLNDHHHHHLQVPNRRATFSYLEHLEHLKHHEACHGRRGRGDGWDDAPGDHLALVARCLRDDVVGSPQVGARGDLRSEMSR
jgi:hypothetical protein